MKRFYTLCVVLLVLSSLLLSAYAQDNGVGNEPPDPATWMPDANLRNAVRAALRLNANEPLTQQKLLNLNVLNAPRLRITDLTGLEYATNLRSLSVGGNQIRDLTPLANLTRLTGLYIGDNSISDINPLANLTNLRRLGMLRNQITDIRILADLVNLTYLRLAGNPISDTSVLRKLLTQSPNLDVDIEVGEGPPSKLEIEIEAEVPDLFVESVRVNKTTVDPGDIFRLSAVIRNQGEAISGATNVHFYRSVDETITTADTKVRTSDMPSLAADRTKNRWARLTAPDTPGVYYYGVCIEGVENESDRENNCSTAVKITVVTVDVKPPQGEPTHIDIDPSQDDGGQAQQSQQSNQNSGQQQQDDRRQDDGGQSQQSQQSNQNSGQPQQQPPEPTPPVLVELPPEPEPEPEPQLQQSEEGDEDEDEEEDKAEDEDEDFRADCEAKGGTFESGLCFLPLTTEEWEKIKEEIEGGGAPSHPKNAFILDRITLEQLDSETLEVQLDIWLAESDGSPLYLRSIALLESVLVTRCPDKTHLLPNYPNPFNPETWIPYHLANPSDVQITIYDTRGTVVRHLDLGHQQEGYYTSRSRAAYWDGTNDFGEKVSSGIYFYQLQTAQTSLLRKMLILK